MFELGRPFCRKWDYQEYTDGRVGKRGQEMSREYLGDSKVLFFTAWCGFRGSNRK